MDELFTPLTAAPIRVNALWYGPEGSAKTTSIASAANHGRTMIFSSEAGLQLAALRKRGINVENLFVYPPPGTPLTFRGLQEAYKRLQEDLRRDPNSWFAVGVDSATDLTEKVLEASTSERNAKLRKRGLGADIDPWFTDLSDYGTVGKKMRWLMRRLRDLPVHTLITALQKRDVDEDTGGVAYGPAANEGVARNLLAYPDLVLACKPKDAKQPFRAMTKEGGRYRAKDRFDALPKVLVEPTFDRVWQYLQNLLDEDTDPLQKLLPASGKRKPDIDPEEDETE